MNQEAVFKIQSLPQKKVQTLLLWLEQEVADYRDAETYSRNGESADFDYGNFDGQTEMAKKVIAIINNGCNFKIRETGEIQPVDNDGKEL